MLRSIFLLLLPFAVRAQSGSAASSTCSATLKEVTSVGCGASCDDCEPCIVFDNTTDWDNNTADPCADGLHDCLQDINSTCEFLCLPYSFDTTFGLLVDFGSYQSDEEKARRATFGDEWFDSQVDELNSHRGDCVVVSNDAVQSIGAINLSSNINETYVESFFILIMCPPVADMLCSFCSVGEGRVISGGPAFNYWMKSNVALLKFGDELISSQLQVTSVRLSSLDLTLVIDRLPKLLPPSLTTLFIDNTLQYEFPLHLSTAFPSLSSLYVGLSVYWLAI